MARQAGIKIENRFVKGLITERTGLNFEPGSCQETFNCVFDKTGLVTRRLGVDFEDSKVESAVVSGDTLPVIEFVWSLVGSTGDKKFLVVQKGSVVYFFDISDSNLPSQNKHAHEINLVNKRPDFSSASVSGEPCTFAEGRGVLLVTHKYCDPFIVEYDPDTDTFTETSFELKIRDFVGIEDSLEHSDRPVVADLQTLFDTYPEHTYNLLNQGWFVGYNEGRSIVGTTPDGDIITGNIQGWSDSALKKFIDDTNTSVDIEGVAPNDYDTVNLYRASETNPFSVNYLINNSAGSNLAAKGHFIINVGYPERRRILSEEFNISGILFDDGFESIIDLTGLTTITNFDTRTTAAFDGDTTQILTAATTHSGAADPRYIGKTFSTAQSVYSALVFGTLDSGFTNPYSAGLSVELRLYGKQGTAPSAWNDGTRLGTTVVSQLTDESIGRAIYSNDNETEWDHIWVAIRKPAGGTEVWAIAEVVFITADPPEERVDKCAFYAGRAWYAGSQQRGVSDKGATLYFSQIIEDIDQFGRCYQKQDPAHEAFFDLLPDDGGTIKILEMGRVVKLYPYQNVLFVFAENGVWTITGGNGVFQANDYNVRKISSIGNFSPHSFVDVKGAPMWWGESGIYTVQYDLQSDNFQVIDLTENTIQSFYYGINTTNRKYVKGCYDPFENTVYWLYRSGAIVTDETKYRYNSVLCLNLSTGAFYPWTLEDHPSANYYIRGITYINNPTTPDLGVVKLTITLTAFANFTMTFGEFNNTSYYDWTSVDYDSYFISYYQLDGQTMNFFQTNCIVIFSNVQADSSAYLQSIWDFTNTANSGKWSSSQQIYRHNAQKDVVARKLHLRGHGRAVQLKVRSEEGKPFNIIGWSMYESTNTIP